jgi:tryptophanyl-tRNA synthetase
MSQTILTGLRANGELHIGNYLGALLPMADLFTSLKADDKFYLFIPDLHSITTPVDYHTLKPNIYTNLKFYLASGIHPNGQNSFVWRQSKVSSHAELAWILSCFAYFGEMSKMTQFKDKKANSETVSAGYFTYPILMAADILLYDAEFIPLGDDQKQHLELARDLAIRINNRFDEEIFTVPREWKEQLAFMERTEGVRVRSLKNPEKKMSKSVSDPKGTISLLDDPAVAAKKIMSAATDSFEEVQWDWKERPGITNLLQLAYLLEGKNVERVKQEWTGQNQYGPLKKHVASLVQEFLTTLQTKMAEFDDTYLENILSSHEVTINEIASKKRDKALKAVGLL